VNSPKTIAQVAIEVFERSHGCIRRVRKRSESAGRGESALVVLNIGSLGNISLWTVAGGEPPGAGAVSFVLAGIFGGVCAFDQSKVTIVLEIIGVKVGKRVWVEAQV